MLSIIILNDWINTIYYVVEYVNKAWKVKRKFFSTHYLERSERPKRSLSIDQLERSERLKGSWSTYYLERSERLMEFWSIYIIEQSERLKLFPSAHNLERSEKLKRSWSTSQIEWSERLNGSWSTHYLERSERLKGSISFICNVSFITLIPQIVNFFVKTEIQCLARGRQVGKLNAMLYIVSWLVYWYSLHFFV